MANPWVIDLSHHNPTPDWTTLVANGTIGIIHKATEGTSYKDPTLYDRAAEAVEAGLLWSTYHFLRPGGLSNQMDWYLEVVDPVEGERMVLDHEDAGVSVDDLAEAVNYLLAVRPDVQVTIYSGHLIKEQLGNSKDEFLAKHTSLWIAQYTSAATPSWPTGTWPVWSLWQYTDKATVMGITAPVDANKWNGDEASLRAWMTPMGSVPEPIPPFIGRRRVVLSVEADPGVDVVINVNGKEVAS